MTANVSSFALQRSSRLFQTAEDSLDCLKLPDTRQKAADGIYQLGLHVTVILTQTLYSEAHNC